MLVAGEIPTGILRFSRNDRQRKAARRRKTKKGRSPKGAPSLENSVRANESISTGARRDRDRHRDRRRRRSRRDHRRRRRRRVAYLQLR